MTNIRYATDVPVMKMTHKDKDKDEMTKIPNLCHIFENDMTQGGDALKAVMHLGMILQQKAMPLGLLSLKHG